MVECLLPLLRSEGFDVQPSIIIIVQCIGSSINMSGSANLDIIMDGSSTSNKQNTNDEKMADGAPEIREDNSEEELVLPPEVWASVMECKLLVY